MRRKQKPWQEKVDSFALAYMDAHKQTRGLLNFPEGDLKGVMKWFEEHQGEILGVYDKFPRPSERAPLKTVKLDKGFVKFMESVEHLRGFKLQPGENMMLPALAETFSMAQKLFRVLEKKRANRALVYWGISFAYALVRPIVEDFRTKQFGPEPLDWEKKRILAAMCLDFISGLLRGRVEAPKGRINMEMMKYINLIQKHQTEPLTDRDLRDALAHAGFAVPAEDHSWSVFLNRARKRGLVDKRKRITAVGQNPHK